MSEPIDIAALALLRAIVADVESGRMIVTRCHMDDDAEGQRLVLGWAPPSGTVTPGTVAPVAPAPIEGVFLCPICKKPAEILPEENGGGWWCPGCNESG